MVNFLINFPKTRIIGILLIFLTIFFILTYVRAYTDPFRPSDGTSSTYRWDFEGFRSSGALNDTHIDHNDIISADSFDILNPTYAEFSVSYSTFGAFLEETIDGTMHNATHSLRFIPSFLIDPTNHIYVNEKGEGSNRTTVGYINPNNIDIGSKILLEAFMANVTTETACDVADTTREAWKLEYISNILNITAFYDTVTGILLKMDFKTIGGGIGDIGNSTDCYTRKYGQKSVEEVSTRIQTLISTNAWDTDKNGLIPFADPIIPFICLAVISMIQKSRKK